MKHSQDNSNGTAPSSGRNTGTNDTLDDALNDPFLVLSVRNHGFVSPRQGQRRRRSLPPINPAFSEDVRSPTSIQEDYTPQYETKPLRRDSLGSSSHDGLQTTPKPKISTPFLKTPGGRKQSRRSILNSLASPSQIATEPPLNPFNQSQQNFDDSWISRSGNGSNLFDSKADAIRPKTSSIILPLKTKNPSRMVRRASLDMKISDTLKKDIHLTEKMDQQRPVLPIERTPSNNNMTENLTKRLVEALHIDTFQETGVTEEGHRYHRKSREDTRQNMTRRASLASIPNSSFTTDGTPKKKRVNRRHSLNTSGIYNKTSNEGDSGLSTSLRKTLLNEMPLKNANKRRSHEIQRMSRVSRRPSLRTTKSLSRMDDGSNDATKGLDKHFLSDRELRRGRRNESLSRSEHGNRSRDSQGNSSQGNVGRKIYRISSKRYSREVDNSSRSSRSASLTKSTESSKEESPTGRTEMPSTTGVDVKYRSGDTRLVKERNLKNARKANSISTLRSGSKRNIGMPSSSSGDAMPRVNERIHSRKKQMSHRRPFYTGGRVCRIGMDGAIDIIKSQNAKEPQRRLSIGDQDEGVENELNEKSNGNAPGGSRATKKKYFSKQTEPVEMMTMSTEKAKRRNSNGSQGRERKRIFKGRRGISGRGSQVQNFDFIVETSVQGKSISHELPSPNRNGRKRSLDHNSLSQGEVDDAVAKLIAQEKNRLLKSVLDELGYDDPA